MKLTRRQWLCAGVGTAALGSWWWMRDASPNHWDVKRMKVFTENMKSVCVGRFLIDAPPAVKDASGSYESQIAGVRASVSPYRTVETSAQALNATIKQRESDLRSQPPTPSGGSRFLGSYEKGSTVRILYYLTSDMQPERMADGYVARDNGVFFFQTNANSPADAKRLLDFLVEIEPKLTILSPGQLPTTPGFCIDNGLIATNPERGENVNSWGWTLPGHPDVSFGFTSRTNDEKVEPGIVDREGSIISEAGALLMQRVSTLRRRRFEIAGMPAQEWSIEITDSRPAYQLDIELPGKPNDNYHPHIGLSMRVGGSHADGYLKPSLTTGEALALWDAVTGTLRLRPGAM